MSDFTRQKWITRGANAIIIAPDEVAPDKQAVSFIAHTEGQGYEVNKANARLIAHAPEMYQLLVKILNDEQSEIDPDIEGDVMWVLKEINGGHW